MLFLGLPTKFHRYHHHWTLILKLLQLSHTSLVWPAQSCKSPTFPRMFLLRNVINERPRINSPHTAQKITISIKDFFSKCDQICRKLRIWSHLLKKSLMENFIFCAVSYFFQSLCLTPRLLSKKINLDAKKASSDPSFLQYLFKHNFFAMSAIALQRSELLWPNDDVVSMWVSYIVSCIHKQSSGGVLQKR